jgi:hypothetical protein
MLIAARVAVAGAVLSQWLAPETKGKTLNQQQQTTPLRAGRIYGQDRSLWHCLDEDPHFHSFAGLRALAEVTRLPQMAEASNGILLQQ